MAPTVALAYIDPGNGAYMVQAMFALVGAALFYLRHPIRSLKELWRWMSSHAKRDSTAHREDISGADAVRNRMSESVPEDRLL
jgi:hypothetical protein